MELESSTNSIETVDAINSQLAKLAKKHGAEYELTVDSAESFSASYQQRKMHKYKVDHTRSASIRVLHGRGAGFAATENLSMASVELTFLEAIDTAKQMAAYAKENSANDEIFFTSEVANVPGLKQPLTLTIDQKLSLARELEECALAYDNKITNVPYSGLQERCFTRALFNSKGLERKSEGTSVTAYTYALAKKGDETQAGYESAFFRSDKLVNAKAIAEGGAKIAIQQLGARPVPSGQYSIILSPDVVAALIGFLVDHLAAQTLEEKTSLLAGQLGKLVLSPNISITDDPLDVALMNARTFDAEGAAAKPCQLFQAGVLKNYLTNSYLARKLGLPHTGHATRAGGKLSVAPSNIVIAAGNTPENDLIKQAPKVLRVDTIDALHSGFKESTLDFSLPIHGLFYENGNLSHPVNMVVMSGNLLALLKSDVLLGSKLHRPAGYVAAPEIFIPTVSIAGA